MILHDLPPCTMCSYTVSLRGLVDLWQRHRGEPRDALWHDWRADWRRLKFERHIEPPTWVLGDRVLAHGDTGILFPSPTHEGGADVSRQRRGVGEPDQGRPFSRSHRPRRAVAARSIQLDALIGLISW